MVRQILLPNFKQMKFTIELPTKPTEIEFISKNEGYIWFKNEDLTIDFKFNRNDEIEPKQLWITGSNLIELNEVKFLSNWMNQVIELNKKEINDQFNNLI